MNTKQMNKAQAAGAQVAQHVPGPWQYEGSMNGKDLTVARVFEDSSKTELAINGGRGYVCTIHTRETGYCIKGTEAEANARLIAAAPELLEALKSLLASEESPHTETVRFLAREDARAAIAKAEGKL